MEINNEEIDRMIESSRNNMLKIRSNGLYLTDNQVMILNRYDINYESCLTMKELIMKIEDYLNYEEDEDLENLSLELSEFDYYHNTNK